MGMDLNGMQPNGEKGEYFRNNHRWWHPLWSYVTHNCDDILTPEQTEEGHYNDGVKIHAWQAQLIADRLASLLESGEPGAIEHDVKERYLQFPQRPCEWCEGTGLTGENFSTCGWCGGTAKRREVSDDWRPFTERNVREFADFCSQSGGFTIW